MIISVHQPQYIPWLGYFDKIAKSDCFVFLDKVQYKPREFQSRNKIRTKDGWMWLSVPVLSKGRCRQNICDVVIDEKFSWRRKHAMALKSCYGSSDFFREYFPFFEKVYAKKWEKLSILNVCIINYILEKLSIKTPIHFESDLDIPGKSTDRIIEICRSFKADTYLSGLGGKDYLEEEKFAGAGIRLVYQDFHHPVYHQEFISEEFGFMPYLSILDLLFNAGPKSRQILLQEVAR
ncbi:hypothetical protein D4Q80_04970 [bacterium]|nr:MAG: hypothetical protein D4Q80_04970 [bacterium]